jgi:hypothetical protein
MKITLIIKDKEKNFITPFIPTKILRKTLNLQKTKNLNDVTAELLDELVEYLVELFGNKFTSDEFYEGYPSSGALPLVTACFNEVMNGAIEATKDLQDPNEEATA